MRFIFSVIPQMYIMLLFISHIKVGECDEKSSCIAEQNIRIIYSVVGVMDSIKPVEDNMEQ
jgi:hypothetical protein